MDFEQVRWVAHLGRLALSDAELMASAAELAAILDFVDQLREADVRGVEAMAHPLDVTNTFRDDTPALSLPSDVALTNAPARRGDYFGVPAVLD